MLRRFFKRIRNIWHLGDVPVEVDDFFNLKSELKEKPFVKKGIIIRKRLDPLEEINGTKDVKTI